MHITSTSGGDLDVSYWLGGNAGQNMNLSGLTTATLASLGFGAINDNLGTAVGSRDVSLTAGVPSGSVNAILFGAKSGDNDDYFKIGSMGGATASAVPEPSSVILLFTVAALGLKLSRRSQAVAGNSPSRLCHSSVHVRPASETAGRTLSSSTYFFP